MATQNIAILGLWWQKRMIVHFIGYWDIFKMILPFKKNQKIISVSYLAIT